MGSYGDTLGATSAAQCPLCGLGEAVQVDPIKPTLKAHGNSRLKLKCDKTAFKLFFQIQLARLHLGNYSSALGAAECHKCAMVGWCMLKPVDTRVESAWFQLLKL